MRIRNSSRIYNLVIISPFKETRNFKIKAANVENSFLIPFYSFLFLMSINYTPNIIFGNTRSIIYKCTYFSSIFKKFSFTQLVFFDGDEIITSILEPLAPLLIRICSTIFVYKSYEGLYRKCSPCKNGTIEK